MHGIVAQHDLALKDYERLFEIQPTAQNLGHVAGMRLQRGDQEGALRDLNQALRMDPTGAVLYGARSFAYEALGRLKDALADVDSAITLYRRQPGYEAGLALPSLERRRVKLRDALNGQ